jgi:hypothetical protein
VHRLPDDHLETYVSYIRNAYSSLEYSTSIELLYGLALSCIALRLILVAHIGSVPCSKNASCSSWTDWVTAPVPSSTAERPCRPPAPRTSTDWQRPVRAGSTTPAPLDWRCPARTPISPCSATARTSFPEEDRWRPSERPSRSAATTWPSWPTSSDWRTAKGILHYGPRPGLSDEEMHGLIGAVGSYSDGPIAVEFFRTKGDFGILRLSGPVSPYVTDSNPMRRGRPLSAILPLDAHRKRPSRPGHRRCPLSKLPGLGLSGSF